MPKFDLEGVAVSFDDNGFGPPVVLLHSSASSSRQWQSLAGALGERHRVLAVDLHGYGETGVWHGRRPIGLADEAAAVAVLARRLGEPVHLVGHSYGGAVAAMAAMWMPRRIASLTLIEPVSFHLLRGGDAQERALYDEISALADAVASAVNRGDEHGAMARFVDYWNGAGAWEKLSFTARLRLAPLARKVVLDFAAAMGDATRRAACRTVSAPTLVLRGDRSPAPTRHIAALLAEFVPGARLETIPGAGHMLPLTHAAEINHLIAAHIASTAAANDGWASAA
jgi:pimeloyl-ACP methyl ester carboxylesterase